MEALQTAAPIGIITIIVQLIFLEGILSIDNAAVLGAMVSVLPDDKPVPYPELLKFLQSPTNRHLGMQRAAALKVGLLGAYLGRGLMLAMAVWIIANPFLKILGAAYLIKLAFEHLGDTGLDQANQEGQNKFVPKAAVNFWRVVLNVELADLAFSLDNVVAAVALSNQLWVVMVGVALGIITMRFAATAFTWLIQREPILEQAAYIIVLNIGVELLLAEFYGFEIAAWEKFAVSAATLILCVAYAHLRFLHVLAPVLHWLSTGMGLTNKLIEWAMQPFIVPIKFIISSGKKVLGKWRRPIGPATTPSVTAPPKPEEHTPTQMLKQGGRVD